MKINRSDHVLMLLKSELKSLKSDTSSASEATTKSQRRNSTSDAITRLRNLLNRREISENQIHEALIRAILTDEFGVSVSNDPAFIALSLKVTRTLMADEDGKQIMDDALLSIMGS